MDAIDVSVIVLTYNSDFAKIIKTVQSLLIQKDVCLEIIMADDGSKSNHYEELQKYFEEKDFKRYAFADASENLGTIGNLLRAMELAKGKYVKPFSPGDYLDGECALREWMDAMEAEGARWSFCDVAYYNPETPDLDTDRIKKHPMVRKPYRSKNLEQIKYNYIVLGDTVIGASVICENRLLKDYVGRIAGSIRYAEDHAYKLMIWDDIYPLWFQEPIVKYEFGTGVSTSRNRKWMKILLAEMDQTNRLLFQDDRELSKNEKRILQRVRLMQKLGFLGYVINSLQLEVMRRVAN